MDSCGSVHDPSRCHVSATAETHLSKADNTAERPCVPATAPALSALHSGPQVGDQGIVSHSISYFLNNVLTDVTLDDYPGKNPTPVHCPR